MRKAVLLSFALIGIIYADTRLDESVISTTGFEDNILNEVKNVNIITKDDIEKRSDSDLNELLERAPGISLQKMALGWAIDMRGQGNRANTNVQVMVNGVSMNMTDSTHSATPLDAFSLDDVERIEIIPGGGAVLYGSGTQGGVINIITKTIPQNFYANVATKYSQSGSTNARFNIGGLVSENLFLKSSFYTNNTDGYRQGDKNRGAYGSFGLQYQIAPEQKISANFSHFKGKTYSSGASTRAMLDENRRNADTKNISKLDIKLTNLNVDYNAKLSDKLELNVTPFYQDTKFKPSSQSRFTDKKYGARTKLKYSYSFGNFITGYDYIYNKGKNDGSFDLMMSPKMRFVNISKGSTTKTTNSIFFINKFDFTDEFSLSAGYRFENAEYKILKNTFSKIAPAAIFDKVQGKTTKADISKDENNYAFEIMPNYKYSDSGNVYVKFERGFTSPSANKMQNKDARLGYYPSNIEPETYKTYEVGIKDLVFGQYFSATLFYTNSKNEISTIGKPPTYWTQVNIGETQRKGFEIYSEQALLDDSLRLSQSFTYTDTKIKKSGTSGYAAGSVVPNVAKYKVVLGVDYDINKNFTIFADSKFYGDQRNTSNEKLPAYSISDVGVRYKNKGFTVTGGVNNVFDKEYFTSADYKKDSFYVGDGRNLYVELKYDF
ncbi:TonB-dependent receptor [Campylobacter geochelonis]|uniref:TonB-dependent receptor n=1 Tax=Campylobacter geochelonis TaxID=1780362 RepID=UPI0007708889|nr:TonB-dependent receptor [Campylobacter geochelonis]CZE45878.1 tonB-dependent receptor [Campylobacter geochelonis]